MNNHYVSKLVIKRFSKALNAFDIHTGKITENKNPDKVFAKKGIIDDDIEKIMNVNIESRVANIIDQKIADKDSVVITRDELFVLKRYMLINSIRSMGLDYDKFGSLMRSFLKNANQYLEICTEYKILPDLNQVNIDNRELYQRTLKVFSSTTCIRDIAFNPLATREMIGWALPFIESYIAFWDAPDGFEFILTDVGMSSEYEGFHQITGGIDISKVAYLLAKSNTHPGHIGILVSNSVMYENYNFFVLNSKRIMVMINPFFRLYYGQRVLVDDECVLLPKPDIWPAVIQDKRLFEPPKNNYVISKKEFTTKDEYIYTPKRLTQDDYIYINELNLSFAKDVIGFNDPMKIIDAIYYHVWKTANYQSVLSLNDDFVNIIKRLSEGVARSPYQQLISYCEQKSGCNITNFISLFEDLTDNIYKDFKSNPYICEYYLAMPEETAGCKQLDFLGKGDKKLEYFSKLLSEIRSKKNDIPS